jgi:hypothetical protein
LAAGSLDVAAEAVVDSLDTGEVGDGATEQRRPVRTEDPLGDRVQVDHAVTLVDDDDAVAHVPDHGVATDPSSRRDHGEEVVANESVREGDAGDGEGDGREVERHRRDTDRRQATGYQRDD